MPLQMVNLSDADYDTEVEVVAYEIGGRLAVCVNVGGVCVVRVGLPKPGTGLIVGRVRAELASWPEETTDSANQLV